MDRLIIETDITEWNDEYVQEERDVSDKDKIVVAARDGVSLFKLGRMAVVARERGDAPKDIIAPNLILINQGAGGEVQGIISSRRCDIELPNGKKVTIRKWVAPVDVHRNAPENVDQGIMSQPSPEPKGDPAIVYSLTDIAVKRAIKYLLRTVPAHVKSRLDIIAANKEDVRGPAEELCKIIMGMVSEYE